MPSKASLQRNAMTLAVAGGIEYALQLAVPILLVRYLDQTTFGQYRLLWLLAATVLAIAPAFMPQSLFYFLPRASAADRRPLISNVLMYLLGAACIVALVTAGWNIFLPETARTLFFQSQGISSIFLGLWLIASLLDVLPTADGRAIWQAKAAISVALLRTFFLVMAAVLTADIFWLTCSLVMAALIKLSLALYYAFVNVADKKFTLNLPRFKGQLIYALPFAVGNAFFLLRLQADQWVVASMLTPAMYATFSIAAVFLPLATLIRQPVNNVMMPRLSHAHARGDYAEIGRLIVKSNGATALLLIPVAGALFATTAELVEIIYTSQYRMTAPIMQVYLVGMMITTIAVGHVMTAIDKGRFLAINNFFCLLISIALSILGVMQWGLVGAALGSVSALVFSELVAVYMVARTLQMPMHQLLAWRILAPAVLGTCFGLYGVALLNEFIRGNVWQVLFAKGAAFLMLYAGFFLLSGGKKHFGLLVKSHS